MNISNEKKAELVTSIVSAMVSTIKDNDSFSRFVIMAERSGFNGDVSKYLADVATNQVNEILQAIEDKGL